ncbi:MAG: LacI family transcriptional regulator [Treponema sp.]|nr:LacI family transcriptional regulator [Treponema sp.]
MKKYTTLKDVARLAETTAGTVSYVLNEKKGRYISEETREKVLRAAKKLDYIKCNGASSLKGKDRKLIAVFVPRLEDRFFIRIIAGAGEVLGKYGYDMVICNTMDDPDLERDIIRRMLQQRVDGILLVPTRNGFENTAALRRLGIKMVVVDRPLEKAKNFFGITTDNYECGLKGAVYLMEKGHTSIAYIGWKSCIADLDRRRQAVLDTAKNVVIEEGDFSPEEGYRLTAAVLDKQPDVSAFFYGFSVQAQGGIKCLIDRGIAIPKSKSVLIIGSPEWAVTGRNNFTHVDMGEHDMGTDAAELLINMIRHPRDKPEKHRIQNCTLVEGDSVAPGTTNA